MVAWREVAEYKTVEHIDVVVVEVVESCRGAFTILDSAFEPLQFVGHPLAELTVEVGTFACHHHADGTGIVFHALGAVGIHSLVEGGHGIVVHTEEVLYLADGGKPQGGCRGLLRVDHLTGVGDEVHRLVAEDDA